MKKVEQATVGMLVKTRQPAASAVLFPSRDAELPAVGVTWCWQFSKPTV
jgi:hypothetical protein